MGGEPPYRTDYGEITPQGGPPDEKKETSEANLQRLRVSPIVGGYEGERDGKGGVIHHLETKYGL